MMLQRYPVTAKVRLSQMKKIDQERRAYVIKYKPWDKLKVDIQTVAQVSKGQQKNGESYLPLQVLSQKVQSRLLEL